MTTDHERQIAMAMAVDNFAWQVGLLTDDDWRKPTPCDGWSVYDIVDHVVAGEHYVMRVMGGATADEAADGLVGLDASESPAEHRRRLDEASDGALTAFTTDLDQLVNHRVGKITARLFLEYRFIDQLGHTWDIATAAGHQLETDPTLLQLGVDIARAERETLERSPNFATSADDDIDTSDLLSEFVSLIGRRPDAS